MSDIRFTRAFRAAVERHVTNDDVVGDGLDVDNFAQTFAGGWSAAFATVLDIMGPAGRHDIEEGEPGEIERLRAEVDYYRKSFAAGQPPPAMRLAMYRAAALGALLAGTVRDTSGSASEAARIKASAVEVYAHAMLAGERAPEVQR